VPSGPASTQPDGLFGQRQILRRHSKDKKQPSLTLHLYTSHFRFEQQVSLLVPIACVLMLKIQNGVFLFESPMKASSQLTDVQALTPRQCFLEYVREQRLPSELLDILDQAKVPFYEGQHRVSTST
jgi:transcription factor SPT20